MTTAERHQLRIARQTLNMPEPMVNVMGGMTTEQAKAVVERARKNAARKEREQAMRDCGLTRCKDSQGRTIWE
jgi:hypothetical protein